jgi:phenylpyruvate tautomerase PptA (4-oxalocrotonate tautomerase family)
MPIIQAHILKGYDHGTRTRLSHALTDAVRLVIAAPPDSIVIMVHELEPENYMRGGGHRQRGVAMPDTGDLVRRFHNALTSGEFEAAETFLTADCVFVLPGGRRVSHPHEVASFTASRWTELSIKVESTDVCHGPAGAIVYLRTSVAGDLQGGGRVDGLRAIQRFEFRGPLIARVDAMSDMTPPLPKRT